MISAKTMNAENITSSLSKGGNGPPKFFETSEEPLDFIAASIDDLVIFPWDKMVGIWGESPVHSPINEPNAGFHRLHRHDR